MAKRLWKLAVEHHAFFRSVAQTSHLKQRHTNCYAQFTPPARRDKTVLSVSCRASELSLETVWQSLNS